MWGRWTSRFSGGQSEDDLSGGGQTRALGTAFRRGPGLSPSLPALRGGHKQKTPRGSGGM